MPVVSPAISNGREKEDAKLPALFPESTSIGIWTATSGKNTTMTIGRTKIGITSCLLCFISSQSFRKTIIAF
jgi:hypothetical protein